MRPTAKKKRLLLRDHLLREATLLEYAGTHLAQAAYLLNTIALNYPGLCNQWLQWGTVLASLQHQMEAQSQLLCSTATRVSKDMGETPITLKEALERYSELREVKND